MPETTLDPPESGELAHSGQPLRCADPLCGVEFTPRRPGHKYHSPRCRKRHWEATHGRGAKPGTALSCPHCGTALVLALQPACLPSEARRA